MITHFFYEVYSGGGKSDYICSNCRKIVFKEKSGLDTNEMFKYCPRCGCDNPFWHEDEEKQV